MCVSKNDQSQDFQTKEYSTWGNKRQTLKKKVYWWEKGPRRNVKMTTLIANQRYVKSQIFGRFGYKKKLFFVTK